VACCSLATANANAAAGDTVILRGGTYNCPLAPVHSGTQSAKITWINYTGETPVIHFKDTGIPGHAAPVYWYYYGILLSAVSWHKIWGINVDSPPNTEITQDYGRPLVLVGGASYNEIAYTDINANRNGYTGWWTSNAPITPNVHNWLHHYVLRNTGHLYEVSPTEVAATMGLQIGIPGYDWVSGNNTVENGVIYNAGHHCIEVFSQYNVFKHNYMHNEGNEPWSGVQPLYGPDSVPPAVSTPLWGHRVLSMDCYQAPHQYALIESNRLGYAGPPSEDDGGDCLCLTTSGNIVRYNDIYHAQNNGILMKYQSPAPAYGVANANRVFNNTIFNSGRYNNIGAPYLANQWEGCGIRWYGGYQFDGNAIINNIVYQSGGGTDVYPAYAGTNRIESNWLTANGDPEFTNPEKTVLDPTNALLPDLTLQAGSPCIGAAEPLTHAVGAGAGSTTLVVGVGAPSAAYGYPNGTPDALFFQDGTWGSALTHGVTLFPDWIAIGTVGNIVQIQAVDYVNNVITLASPMTWNDGASIWLYSNSDGVRVLYGTAPDLGAHPVVR
jgi:hypothetical protein